MKAFLSACLAMLVIAALAGVALHYGLDGSTQAANTAERGSVRLN